MNKFSLISLSIIGGIEVVFYMFTPTILSVLWVKVIGLVDWTSYFLFSIGLIATIFRAIKVGFLKKQDGN